MSKSVFYNDNDAYCAQWLRNLIEAGHLPAGDVDGRSIVDVRPTDLVGHQQCHFFAGIGGWPLAIRLAGYEGSVWTGSCPCQPFSSAGKQSGSADERHLWPRWFRLIRECRPDTIFGEQVEGAIGFGWIDRVFADLEAEGYACGAAVLGAHSVGAPHIRQRLFWVADSERGRQLDAGSNEREHAAASAEELTLDQRQLGEGCSAEGGGLVNASGAGLALTRSNRGLSCATLGAEPGEAAFRASAWDDAGRLPCLDGKARRVIPSIFPLADGVPNRVGLLRGAGNAIVPQVAAEFVNAFLEIAAKSEERTSAREGGLNGATE